MKQVRSPAFCDERSRFALRFTCEHCSYFQVETERCTHGYPNAAHRLANNAEADGPHGELLFCKEFELM
jgi:hypothetical protein